MELIESSGTEEDGDSDCKVINSSKIVLEIRSNTVSPMETEEHDSNNTNNNDDNDNEAMFVGEDNEIEEGEIPEKKNKKRKKEKKRKERKREEKRREAEEKMRRKVKEIQIEGVQ